MGPPFHSINLSLFPEILKNCHKIQGHNVVLTYVIDLMWGPNGITGKYIAMFLDNFSPFQNKDETRLASNPICFQYDDSKSYQLK